MPLRPFIDYKVDWLPHLQAAYDYLHGLITGGAPHTHEIADVTGLQGALDGKEAAGVAAAAVAAHEAAGDPHPQYLTAAEGDAAYEALGAVATHAAQADPHPAYQRESEKDAANGYAGLDGSSKLNGAQQKYGSAANTAAEGNDVRLSDARTPLAHKTSHENGGTDEISVAGLSGLLADGQTPLAHKTSHQSGGSDAIKLDDLAAPDDNTDLNASTSAHGLMQKYPGGTSNFLRSDGAFAAPTSTPADLANAPGSFTLVTATFRVMADRLEINGTEEVILEGDSTLVII